MTTLQIQPIDLHVAFATSLGFQLTSMDLGKSASFQWYLDGDTGLLLQGNITMSGEDYQGWNNDDPYVSDWVCKQLNVQPLVESPVVEPSVVSTSPILSDE